MNQTKFILSNQSIAAEAFRSKIVIQALFELLALLPNDNKKQPSIESLLHCIEINIALFKTLSLLHGNSLVRAADSEQSRHRQALEWIWKETNQHNPITTIIDYLLTSTDLRFGRLANDHGADLDIDEGFPLSQIYFYDLDS